MELLTASRTFSGLKYFDMPLSIDLALECCGEVSVAALCCDADVHFRICASNLGDPAAELLASSLGFRDGVRQFLNAELNTRFPGCGGFIMRRAPKSGGNVSIDITGAWGVWALVGHLGFAELLIFSFSITVIRLRRVLFQDLTCRWRRPCNSCRASSSPSLSPP